MPTKPPKNNARLLPLVAGVADAMIEIGPRAHPVKNPTPTMLGEPYFLIEVTETLIATANDIRNQSGTSIQGGIPNTIDPS